MLVVYNKAALSERTCREWFQKFENGDFDVEDNDRSGKPIIYKDTELEEDLFQTQKELALNLEATQQAVSHRLKSLGIIHKQGVPVKNYLKTLDWEVPSHPPYSPDIALFDYHLFRRKLSPHLSVVFNTPNPLVDVTVYIFLRMCLFGMKRIHSGSTDSRDRGGLHAACCRQATSNRFPMSRLVQGLIKANVFRYVI
ncbi:Mariner Mos1 transposase [Eumeta japonica]|uniref:Mariner Mos1 transposase n=1 Tax=Eumeta variegata TaxID=151549 RepID=A0A4C1VDH9_EUMVA|nr:Mariner Mos1 transposase [Eumeta japonica]